MIRNIENVIVRRAALIAVFVPAMALACSAGALAGAIHIACDLAHAAKSAWRGR